MSEFELISLLKNNPNHGFKILYDVYWNKLYTKALLILSNHDDAFDATQNTFLNVWRNIEKFRGDAKIYSWMYRIVTNESLLIITRKKAMQNLESKFMESIPLYDNHLYIGTDKIIKALNKAVNKLPPKQKEVFMLRYYNNMDYGIMAKELNSKRGTLRVTYNIAVKKIEKELSNGI